MKLSAVFMHFFGGELKPIGTIGTVPMAYEELLAYKALNVAYDIK